MCLQVIERFAVCRCIYYAHAIDACPAYGRRGHLVSCKDELVGYSCSRHSTSIWKKNPVILTDESSTQCNYCLSNKLRCSGDTGDGNGCESCWRLDKVYQYPKGHARNVLVDAAVVPIPAPNLLVANEESISTFSNHSSLTDGHVIRQEPWGAMRSIEDDTDHYCYSDGGSASPRWPKPEVSVQMNPSSKPRISPRKTSKSWELEPSPERENSFGKSVRSRFSDENLFETGFNEGFEKNMTENDPNACATFVRAIYDWKSSEDGELSFAKDDIIEVLTKSDSGWWYGLLRQSRGWFPSDYCVRFISKQGPLEEHPVEATKLKLEPRPLAEDQNMSTYGLSPSLEDSIFDFNIGDPFEAKATASDLNMAKQILKNSSTQGKGFNQSNPLLPLWIGGNQHLLSPALKNHSSVRSAERNSAFMKFLKYEVAPQIYHFRPGMRGLQVTISTDPASHQSHKDSGDRNKEMSHMLKAAENKADDQLEGLEKDPSPRIQRGELTIAPLIHGKNESTPLHRDLSPKPISSSTLEVMVKVVSTFLVLKERLSALCN